MSIDRRTFTGLTLAALASPAHAAPGDRVIPLNLDGGVPIVPVTLNGKGPYPFAIATGQLFAVIRDDLAKELDLQSRAAPPMPMYTVRGRVPLQLYKADTFNLGGVWPMRNVEMMSRPMSQSVAGIFPFLSIQMSTFDFEAREMRAHRARVQPPPGATKHAIIQLEGVRAIREAPKIRAQYGGRTLQLLVNTGSSTGLTLYPDAVRRLGLWDRYPQTGASTAEDRDGRMMDMREALGDPFELGGHVFERPLVTMMSPDMAREDWIDMDGVIGMEILRRFTITFDPVKQNVWFAPNSRVDEPFQT